MEASYSVVDDQRHSPLVSHGFLFTMALKEMEPYHRQGTPTLSPSEFLSLQNFSPAGDAHHAVGSRPPRSKSAYVYVNPDWHQLQGRVVNISEEALDTIYGTFSYTPPRSNTSWNCYNTQWDCVYTLSIMGGVTLKSPFDNSVNSRRVTLVSRVQCLYGRLDTTTPNVTSFDPSSPLKPLSTTPSPHNRLRGSQDHSR